MKTGKTVTELAVELERQLETRRDFVADTRQMEMTADDVKGGGISLHVGDNSFPINDIAHRQIGEKIGIPAKYYDRMREEAPDLLASNVNKWFEKEPERRMVRTLDGRCRAMLSDRFRTLDNFDLATAVLPKLTEADAEIVSCDVTETKMYIKAFLPGKEVEIWPEGVEDKTWGEGHHLVHVLQPGCVISNSEVGHGKLSVSPGIMTKHCSNLAVWKSEGMAKLHLGRVQGGDEDLFEIFSDATKEVSDAALFAQLADTVQASLTGEIFERIVERLKEARGEKIEGDPVKAIEVVQNRFSLNDTERAGVLRHLVEGGDLSAYGLHNAVTRFSADVEDYDRASELEVVGAVIIELAPKDWREIAMAA